MLNFVFDQYSESHPHGAKRGKAVPTDFLRMAPSRTVQWIMWALWCVWKAAWFMGATPAMPAGSGATPRDIMRFAADVHINSMRPAVSYNWPHITILPDRVAIAGLLAMLQPIAVSHNQAQRVLPIQSG